MQIIQGNANGMQMQGEYTQMQTVTKHNISYYPVLLLSIITNYYYLLFCTIIVMD